MGCLTKNVFDEEELRHDNTSALFGSFGIVSGAPYIWQNPRYASYGKRVKVIYDNSKDDPDYYEINAYATLTASPEVHIKPGLVSWASVYSIVAAMLFTGNGSSCINKLCKFTRDNMADCLKTPATMMNLMCAQYNIPTDGYFLDLRARMMRLMLLFAVAHEFGHICLGHYPLSCGADTGGVSRNDERAADTFAFATMQSVGTGEAGAVGAISMLTGLAMSMGRRRRYDGMHTHPADLERIRNAFSSFANVLKYSRVKLNTIERIFACK